jgi:hypothetical protein
VAAGHLCYADAETAHALSEPGLPRPAGRGSADGDGHRAVTALFREQAVLRRIDHGRVTALPDPAAPGPPAAAW